MKTCFRMLALSALVIATPAQAQAPFECRTCLEDCQELGLAPGERICVMTNGANTREVETDTRATGDAVEITELLTPSPEPDPKNVESLQTGLVEWDYITQIEARSSDGGVSVHDAQRTLQLDEAAIRECFHPQGYPGTGLIDVTMHLGYNGVPLAINGSPVNLRPKQARCILRRAWGYDFPRQADAPDQPSTLKYRVDFIALRRGLPDPDGRPRFLLERVQASDPALQPPLSAQLFGALPGLERCALLAIEDVPQDLLVTSVDMSWTRQNGTYLPSDLDLTLTNHTGTERVSQETLDCFQEQLTRTDLTLDDAPDEISASFFLTLRPAGWIDPE